MSDKETDPTTDINSNEELKSEAPESEEQNVGDDTNLPTDQIDGSSTDTEDVGNTPLHVAAMKFDAPLVEKMIKDGLSVNRTNAKDRTALHVMILTYLDMDIVDQARIHKKLIAVLEVLVNNEIDINLGDYKQNTALHDTASHEEQPDVIKALIMSGAKVNQTNSINQTALHIAVLAGALSNAEALMEAGASPDAQDIHMNTPLHLALKTTKIIKTQIFNFLIKCGADVNKKDKRGKAPLHIAVKKSKADIIKNLLKSGAKVNEEDASGQAPMHLAAVHEMTGNAMRTLLEFRGDVNLKDSIYNETPFHKSVKYGTFENFKLLAKARADPNCQDVLGDTVLHKAGHCPNMFIWSRLMALGGDVNVGNFEGITPLFNASKAKNYVALSVMRQYNDS